MDWIDALVGSLTQLTVPSVLLMLLVGIVVGAIVGIVPGLGSLVAMAIMLPFTFTMSPFEAFALLLATYAVTAVTGDLTSILIGVPGQPDSAALVLDGYPLTQQGQASRAMGATITSSMIGALIGAAALLISIPFLRPLVLALGTPEMFMLALLGIAIVGSVSGKSIMKGIISGALGLLIAAVGTSAQTGLPRFTFGSLYLFEGVPLIPIAVGMFALVEMVDLHRRGGSIAVKGTKDTSSVWQGVKETFKYRGALLRGSLIGVGMGVVPGVGGAVSQWMAYGSAMAISKTPERFGKGAIEGVIAPGASNNSKEGGQLIPTVGFGIPGSAAMAILLGAFLIQGINPGPEMLSTHLDVTLFMVWVLVIANVVGSLLCFPFLRHIAKITFVRGEVILPFILVVVLLGAAASSGAVEDIVLALVAGGLSWVMRRYGWPIVPLLLGVVLGGPAENSLLISVNIYGWSWLTRPGVLIIAGLIVLAIIFAYRARKRGAAAEAAAGEIVTSPMGRSTLIGALIGVVLFAAAALDSLTFPVGSREFPFFVSLIGLIVSLVLVITCAVVMIRNRATPEVEEEDGPVLSLPEAAGVDNTIYHGMQESALSVQARATAALSTTIEEEGTGSTPNKRSAVSAALWFLAAAVTLVVLGFFWGTLVYTFAYLWRVAKISVLWSVIAGAVFAIIVQLAFVLLFKITLPDPLIPLWVPTFGL